MKNKELLNNINNKIKSVNEIIEKEFIPLFNKSVFYHNLKLYKITQKREIIIQKVADKAHYTLSEEDLNNYFREFCDYHFECLQDTLVANRLQLISVSSGSRFFINTLDKSIAYVIKNMLDVRSTISNSEFHDMIINDIDSEFVGNEFAFVDYELNNSLDLGFTQDFSLSDLAIINDNITDLILAIGQVKKELYKIADVQDYIEDFMANQVQYFIEYIINEVEYNREQQKSDIKHIYTIINNTDITQYELYKLFINNDNIAFNNLLSKCYPNLLITNTIINELKKEIKLYLINFNEIKIY